MLSEDRAAADAVPHVAAAWSGKGLTLLQRDQNEGMDFAAHNVTIELLRWGGLLGPMAAVAVCQLDLLLHAGAAIALGAAARGQVVCDHQESKRCQQEGGQIAGPGWWPP